MSDEKDCLRGGICMSLMIGFPRNGMESHEGMV